MTPLKTHKTFEGKTQFWEHDSAQTKTKMKFATFIPEGEIKGCLIWLSGLTCNEENFITKAGSQIHLSKMNLMVICPDTSPRGLNLPHEHESDDFGSGAGFYVNATTPGYKDHYRMYDYIATELYALVQKEFSIASDKISLFGHSMGGHGALVIGLREPKKFRSISAFAPIVNPTAVPWGQKALQGYLGEDPSVWKNYDATELVLKGARHLQPLLIDQGSADPFLAKQLLTNHLSEACQKMGQEIQANLREGYDHSYYFISTFIKSHIEFHAQALNK